MDSNSATAVLLRIDKDIKGMAGNFAKISRFWEHHDFVVEAQINIFILKGGLGDGLYINKAKQTMINMINHEKRIKRNPDTLLSLVNWLNSKRQSFITDIESCY
jgi:hypothetical protein